MLQRKMLRRGLHLGLEVGRLQQLIGLRIELLRR
jgi:hypothetical protein